MSLCQKEYPLRPHVEKQVEDAEVGLETMLALIHLIITARHELPVRQGVFGGYDVAEIGHSTGIPHPYKIIRGLYVVLRGLYVRTNVEQFAHLPTDVHVEVIEIRPLALEERPHVIGIILKERRLTVRTHQSMPMLVTPVGMVADTDVPDIRSLAYHRHGERLQPVGGGNDTTVAESLLHETLMLLHHRRVVATEFLIPLYLTEICCGK